MSGATANASIREWEPRRDRPLCFHWKAVDIDWIKSLDLPLPRNFKHAEARASVLLEALITNLVAPGQWVSYSRRKEWWSNGTRYRGTSYSYATVLPAVDELAALGVLEHDRKPSGNLGWQSRFRATELLQERAKIPTVIYDPVELIRLKDRDDKLNDYRDTNNTISMRRRLEEINEALSAADLELHAPTAKHDGMLLRVGNDHVLYPAMRALYRIFNRGSFSYGGRFYGTWWQQIPKKIRPQLLIDGEPTIEHDYPQLHPNMLYAQIGARLEGDAYAVDGWPRNLVKVAFNILVNAENHDSALRAIALEIGGEGAYARATSLIEAIKLRHPTITRVFHSDAGIRLQRRDADMAETIMRRLIRFRAGCLWAGYCGGWEWTRDGERVASIQFWRKGDRLVLSYRVRQHDGEWQDVEQPTPIIWMPCRFGGARPYFICPGIVNGIACGRRVTKLYGAAAYFLCRHCYRLPYASQREDRYDRALHRANNIRMRLGGESGIASLFPDRPKGMHHKTYEHLQSAVLSAEILAQERLVTVLARLQRRERRSERRTAGRLSKEFWR